MHTDVLAEIGGVTLEGMLVVPEGARGVVVFAHGSGSGRFSPRNQFVAAHLQSVGLATLLVDLLESRESEDRAKVFDIDLLSDRLLGATDYLLSNRETSPLSIGYFGASTGAGAALQAAARKPDPIKAVVSRGGRPDLAAPYLPLVKAPTLLIVGSLDYQVIELNARAYELMTCSKEMVVVPGASHLFEEPAKLGEVARIAGEWFAKHLQ